MKNPFRVKFIAWVNVKIRPSFDKNNFWMRAQNTRRLSTMTQPTLWLNLSSSTRSFWILLHIATSFVLLRIQRYWICRLKWQNWRHGRIKGAAREFSFDAHRAVIGGGFLCLYGALVSSRSRLLALNWASWKEMERMWSNSKWKHRLSLDSMRGLAKSTICYYDDLLKTTKRHRSTFWRPPTIIPRTIKIFGSFSKIVRS